MLKRYMLIVEKLDYQPSMKQLMKYLEGHGFNVSERTVKRDLEALRDEFGFDWVYDRSSNCYFLEGKEDERRFYINMLERAQLSEFLQVNDKGINEFRAYLHSDGFGQILGMNFIAPLFEAARDRCEVDVTYRKFGTEKPEVHTVQPHLIKEFRGRWYLICYSDKHQKPIALGLDRITQISRLLTRFKRKDKPVKELYDNTIGVDTSPGEAELISLHFTRQQVPYVRALPLHPSQTLLSEDENGAVFQLYVMPNYELRQLLLGMGPAVKVLEPEHLANALRDAHRQAAAQYGE